MNSSISCIQITPQSPVQLTCPAMLYYPVHYPPQSIGSLLITVCTPGATPFISLYPTLPYRFKTALLPCSSLPPRKHKLCYIVDHVDADLIMLLKLQSICGRSKLCKRTREGNICQMPLLISVKYPKLLLRPGRSNSGHVTSQSRPRLSRPAPSHDALDLRYSDHVTPVT
jgi:hypothetical protein